MPEVPVSFLAKDRCPREICGFSSGEGLELCPAVHAEVNAIIQAARAGVSTEGSTLYLTCGVPCKNCLGAIINAGISKVYVTSNDLYDPCSKFMLEHCSVEIITYPSK
jgi:dCMP deaminase